MRPGTAAWSGVTWVALSGSYEQTACVWPQNEVAPIGAGRFFMEYGFWSIVPPLVTIALALAIMNVFIALIFGIFIA